MIKLSIATIASVTGGTLVTGTAESTSEQLVGGSVQTDSRLVEKGSVFFALPGAETDGHLFAKAAVVRGAALVIAERELELDVPVVIVADGVKALADLARFVVAEVRKGGLLTVIAVTGSNGKTTTKNMLRAILSRRGETVAPEGSFNNHVGAPISMLHITESTRYLVVEMGASHAGEIAHLVTIAPPDIAVVLKVGLAHVGEFGGIEETAKAKSEMVARLPATAVAILNLDDDRVARMREATRAAVQWFGRSEAADVRAQNARADASGTTFDVIVGGQRTPARLQILGEHHIMNALAAFSVARQLAIPLDEAAAAVADMPRAERWRMETQRTRSGALVINDAYNASPDSMDAALRTLASLAPAGARRLAVLGEMTELGESSAEHHENIGRLVGELGIDELVVVGDPAIRMMHGANSDENWRGRARFVQTPDEAYELLDAELLPDDTVLLKSSKTANLRFVGDRLADAASA